MAGEGKRFKDQGYKIPKPLILVSSKPMIIKAAESLPEADKWIFICWQEHINNYEIDKALKKYYVDALIVIADKLTEGQASTCLLAKDLINNDEELLIGACDNGMVWNKEEFDKLRKETDCLVWTFRNNAAVKNKPQAYGWVVVDDDNNALRTSVKAPISDNPMNDHAIVGTFWFKRGSIFVEAAENMINKNDRINNEFYVDQCINYVVGAGHKAKVFEIDKYICWGTPDDLKKFEYWENFFEKHDNNLEKKKT
jgi:NDP-sugar pyrophosphorylase family protein